MDALQKSMAAAMQSALQPLLVRLDALEEKEKESSLLAKTPEHKNVVKHEKHEQKKRLPTPKATDDLHKLVRDPIMQLIDDNTTRKVGN